MEEISIITATLNRSSLRNACKSINDQTYSNWHHYVIGDGVLPTDYSHPSRTTIGFSRPIGAYEPSLDKPGGTPNPILRWAVKYLNLGKYLCFLDDDNTYRSDFLEMMVTTLHNSKAGIAICALVDYRDDDLHDGYPELGRCDNSGFLVYSSIAKEIGFPMVMKDQDNIEDYRFIRACAENYGWIRVSDKLVNFGINPCTLPETKRIEVYESSISEGKL